MRSQDFWGIVALATITVLCSALVFLARALAPAMQVVDAVRDLPPIPTFVPPTATRPRVPSAVPQPTRQAGVGDTVTVGPLRYQVLAVTPLGDRIARDPWPPLTTAGSFLLVDLGVANAGTRDRLVVDKDLVVTDREGRTFGPRSEFTARRMLPPDPPWCDLTLPPGVPKRCLLLYELPRDAGGLALTVTDMQLVFGHKQTIALGR